MWKRKFHVTMNEFVAHMKAPPSLKRDGWNVTFAIKNHQKKRDFFVFLKQKITFFSKFGPRKKEESKKSTFFPRL